MYVKPSDQLGVDAVLVNCGPALKDETNLTTAFVEGIPLLKHAPWYIIRSDDRKKARLNCIKHLLSLIPYRNALRE